MMHSAAPALALALAACETPVPSLELELSGGPSQTCPSTDCSKVPMPCDTVLSVRIGAPEKMSAPYLSQCTLVGFDGTRDMCSLSSVSLEQVLLPVRELEVQVAVYPKSVIPTDSMNQLMCPTKVAYSTSTGFPVEQAPVPALGGRAFYHPGDEKVTVTLGCTDLLAISNSCMVENTVLVDATIDEFDTRLPVGSIAAAHLRVSIGEPRSQDGGYVLDPGDTDDLMPIGDQFSATWGGRFALHFTKFACVEVLDEAALVPPTLRCQPARTDGSAAPLHLSGTWISSATVTKILKALPPGGSALLPPEGLTVGLVVDQALSPVRGAVVSSAMGTVEYLSDTGGLSSTATGASGVFVSRDAPFGSQFSISGGVGRPAIVGQGGLVSGKITVVILAASGDAASAGSGALRSEAAPAMDAVTAGDSRGAAR